MSADINVKSPKGGCTGIGCVKVVGAYRLWVCTVYGCVQVVGVYRLWVCTGCGCV